MSYVKHKAITKQLVDSVKFNTKSLSEWIEVEAYYEPIIGKLLEDVNLWEADFHWNGVGINVYFSGTGDHLTDLFKVLRYHGFVLRSERPQANQSEWRGRFTKEIKVNEDVVTLSVSINFASTVCIIRQVGTTMKEVPIYETVCGDSVPGESPKAPINDEIPF